MVAVKSSLCLCKNSFQGAYTEDTIVIVIIMPFKIGLVILLFKCLYESLLEPVQVPDSSLDCVSPNQMRNSHKITYCVYLFEDQYNNSNIVCLGAIESRY
jgi:hypothetical protein